MIDGLNASEDSASRLTISLGKDINGCIKVAALESMPDPS